MSNYSVSYSEKTKLFVVYGGRGRKLGSFRSEWEAWDFVKRQGFVKKAEGGRA